MYNRSIVESLGMAHRIWGPVYDGIPIVSRKRNLRSKIGHVHDGGHTVASPWLASTGFDRQQCVLPFVNSLSVGASREVDR